MAKNQGPVAVKKSGVFVATCSCKSEFQDKEYGKHKRLHNITTKAGGSGTTGRCTICLNIKDSPR